MSAIEVPSLLGGDGLFDAYAHYRDEKTAGVDGGTFTSGSWVTRVLNTEKQDVDGIASLASNQITLLAGTYVVRASAPGVNCDRHKARLRNVTDSTTLGVGQTMYSYNIAGVSRSEVICRFTLTATKVIELQHRCTTTCNTFGLGYPCGYDEIEVYAEVEIWREGQSVLASRIGVTDAAGNFVGTNLESVLAELQANHEADFTNAFLMGGM